MSGKVTKLIDTKGFLCPIPALRARKFLEELNSGDVLAVEATDPKSKKDIPLLCEQLGHDYLELKEHGNVLIHLIKKK